MSPLPPALRIGFVGIGLMGLPMCRRLLAAGHTLTVWNRSPEKCSPLQAEGARVAGTIAELLQHSDVIMLCVSDTAAVEQIVFSSEGIAEHGRAGQLLVDFSSIAPKATREFSERLKTRCGMRWVDAPVSGGVVGAEAGTLVIMAGGDAADIDALRPVLAALSQRVTRMGDTGAGQVTKVCNQLIVAANSLLIAEAVALAQASGVDASQLAPALAGGFADSKPFQILSPRMASGTFTPVQWKVATLAKDLDNAISLGEQTNVPLQLAALAAQRLHAHADHGHAVDDLSSIIGLYASTGEK